MTIEQNEHLKRETKKAEKQHMLENGARRLISG